MKRNTHLISFCAGFKNSQNIISRFKKQAKNSRLFDSIVVHESINDEVFDEFGEKNFKFIRENSRGFGYWLWKPWIILKHLSWCKNGDILIYADVGCEFSSQGGRIFKNRCDLAILQGVAAYSVGKKSEEYKWTKKELLDQFNLDSRAINSDQIAATFIYFMVSNEALEFVNEWFELAVKENWRYLNDNLDKLQLNGFIEHRHDQSIFSMLYKRNGYKQLVKRTNFPNLFYFNNSPVLWEPIHTLRNKTGIPIIAECSKQIYLFELVLKFLSCVKFIFIVITHYCDKYIKKFKKAIEI